MVKYIDYREVTALSKISILGTGSWGIAIGILLNNNGNNVSMWSAFPEEIAELNKYHEHKKLLPGVIIPDSVNFTTDIHCVIDSDVVIFAVPSFAINSVCELIKPYITDDMLIINAGKGLEPKTGKRFTQIIAEALCHKNIVAISGPTHAEEVARKIPTSIVAASASEECAKAAQDILMSPYMRVYTNTDVIGVELGGALKNIIALCAGICDGVGLGDNTKAALITRGLAEITRLGIALGGKAETFMGLAGMGDLIVTCCSELSRNHKAGYLIGTGVPAKEAIAKVGTVEGFYALDVAYNLSKRYNVEMPIINECHRIFNDGISPVFAIEELMKRPKKSELI